MTDDGTIPGTSETPSRLATVSGAWNRFWFAPTSATPLAFVRIGFGLLLMAWTVTLLPDVLDFFGEVRVAETAISGWRWSLFEWSATDTAIWAAYGLLLLSAVAVTVGWFTRAAAITAFVLLLSFQRQNVWVLNSGDLLIRHLGLFVALGASGVALSLDSRRRRRRAPTAEPPTIAVWPLRLVQLQIAAMYLFSAWSKARGDTWADGTAVGYALRIDDLVRFAPPGFVTDQLVLVNLLTYGTLALEIAIPLLVWNRRLRPWVLGAGIAMHLAIDLTLTVGFFSVAVLVGYLAFVPGDTADRWVARIRERLGAGGSVAASVQDGTT